MFHKGTKAYSIFTGTCPKCQESQMYKNTNPYNLPDLMKMHDHCENCGFTYKIEPNFFFGAMYVSYAVSIIFGLLLFFISFYGFRASIDHVFLTIFIGLFALMPYITRLSRNIYINIFVSYDARKAFKGREAV